MKTLGACTVGIFIALIPAALTAAPAHAAQSHPFEGPFGSAVAAAVDDPVSLAVEQSSGDLYVVDFATPPGVEVSSGNRGSIRRFKSNGEPRPFAALGTHVIDGMKGPGGLPCAEEAASCDEIPENGFAEQGDISFGGQPSDVQVAIDESGTATDGNIYVTQTGRRLVSVFAADGHYLGQLTRAGATKKLTSPGGLAVDGAGNVYVGDYGASAIYKYTPSANPPLNTDLSATFKTVERPVSLAIGSGPSAGYMFVARRAGTALSFEGGLVKIKLSDGSLQYSILSGLVESSGDPQGITQIAVDSGSGNVFAALGERLEEWDASGAGSASFVSATDTALTGSRFIPQGIAVNGASSEIYASSRVSTVEVFGPTVVTLPEVVTEPATGITPSRATLNGTVDPDGQELTECSFEYGPTNAYGSTVPCAESVAEIGAGEGPVAVHADVSGLPANGQFTNFRLAAENASEAPVFGANRNFLTVKTAISSSATAIAVNGATLNGTVHPDGGPVGECLFEYGPTNAYGSTVPCAESEAEIGEGLSPVAVHADLSGLESGTTYHFRLVASNLSGQDLGGNRSFVTLPEPHNLTASKTGTGNGWLHSEGPAYAINCGTACTTKSTEVEGEVTLTASGAQFAGWESCPGVESGRECTVEMDADKEAVAEYVANHALTVTKAGTGNGYVYSTPSGINCGGPCTTKTGFFTAASVTLRASGSEFSEWTDCPGVVSGRDCTVGLTSDKAAEVRFGS